MAALQYNDDCENNLAGFQTGGDIWVSLCQGLRIGAEGKVGIVQQPLHADEPDRPRRRSALRRRRCSNEFKDDQAAFIGEASVDLVADILPSVSLRVGYEVLFLNSLVLAGDNFNQTSPYGNQGTAGAVRQRRRRAVLPRCPRGYRVHLVSGMQSSMPKHGYTPELQVRLADAQPDVQLADRATASRCRLPLRA